MGQSQTSRRPLGYPRRPGRAEAPMPTPPSAPATASIQAAEGKETNVTGGAACVVDHLTGPDEKLARDAGRPYHRRRHLRPPGPQRPRHRPQGTLGPRKERTPDRAVSTLNVSLHPSLRSDTRQSPSLRSDGAQVNRNTRPDHAGTAAQIDRNTQLRWVIAFLKEPARLRSVRLS